jgi:pimeloyl-ACP methyl ester carboxylesterase
MTATRTEIATDDGAAPAFWYGAPTAPGVLVLMDGLGMRPAMHEIAARIAAAGYRVLLPDLFHRLGAYTPPDPASMFADPAVRAAWGARLAGTTSAKLVRDLRAYLDALGPAKVGITGYCMGGRLALLAAATYPDRVAAAATYHPGGVVTDAADSPHLTWSSGTRRATVSCRRTRRRTTPPPPRGTGRRCSRCSRARCRPELRDSADGGERRRSRWRCCSDVARALSGPAWSAPSPAAGSLIAGFHRMLRPAR